MRILTVKATCEKVGKGRTKLWQLTKEGRFPRPVKIDGGIGYIEEEVDDWIRQRIADRDHAA